MPSFCFRRPVKRGMCMYWTGWWIMGGQCLTSSCTGYHCLSRLSTTQVEMGTSRSSSGGSVVGLASGILIVQNGHVHMLEWWTQSTLPLKYSDAAIYGACAGGHLAVLKWWQASGLKLKYSGYALDFASVGGHVPILRWWFTQSHWDVQVFPSAVDGATKNGHVAVLDWWKDESGVELQYRHVALDSCRSIETLAWWKSSGLPLKYTDTAMDDCLDPNVLTWWRDSGLALKYSARAMDQASGQGNVQVLDWWLTSGLPLKYSIAALDQATRTGLCEVLAWWAASGLELKIGSPMTLASEHNRPRVLEWWRRFGRCEQAALDAATLSGSVDAMEWWKASGLPLHYDGTALDLAVFRGIVKTVVWWFESGLPLKSARIGSKTLSEVLAGMRSWSLWT